MGGDFDAINRRKRLRPVSTGKRVTPQAGDLAWFRALLEHGPLPSSYLLQFGRSLRQSDKRSRERLTDLFNEDNTPDGGPYLTRPLQQFRTLDSRYNQLVYDLAPAATRALHRSGLTLNERPVRSGPWLHSFMVSCITGSIELATHDRTDVNFIPQSQILERAGAELRHQTRIIDPATGYPVAKDLLPDAVFGLEHQTTQGKRFRFFVVEADRATEPATSQNFNRKSFFRNLLQYEEYVAGGGYRDHLGLTAPLLVLTVSSDPVRLRRMVALTEQRYPAGNNYLLFQSWADFGAVFRPPSPNPGFLAGDWARGGLPAFRIDQLAR